MASSAAIEAFDARPARTAGRNPEAKTKWAAWWRAHVGEDIELRGIFEDADGQGGGIAGGYGPAAP